ncbi:MAG: GGDEF domain-containing protein [Candidatus Omnitrophica bacterium]|nr:GGDEF domain-containing protein [Candidatus Omnitrophota bacterium]
MAVLFEGKRDFLTNCFTREELGPFLDRAFIESQMYNHPVSILLLDVDKFKHYNDKYGHLCGDEILKYFSSTLRLSLEGTEHYPFRYGGDEFLVVFPKKTAAEAYAHTVKIIKNMKSRNFLLKGQLFKMSFSGGITTFPTDANSAEQLVGKADKAMYFSKRYYRGTTTLYTRIWAKRVTEFTGVAVICVVALVLFFGRGLIFKSKGSGQGRSAASPATQRGGAGKSAGRVPQMKQEAYDTIYLKSGGAIQGIVTREGASDTEIKLKMDQGEGLLIFKNSDIQSIERGKK